MRPALAQSQRILVVGVKQVADCQFATRPLQADLRQINFPRNWTFVVACNPIAWDNLQTKADAFETHTAFTNLHRRMTVLNGWMYREALPLPGTAHSTPSMVLRHELGHIVCACPDEVQADRAGGIR
jgi:hypothetical protein